MRVLLDTNILIDVLTQRAPFYTDSARIWTLAEQGQLSAHISAISFNNIYYVVRRLSNRSSADRMMVLLRDIFTTITLDQKILNQAIDAGFTDFEDAIQYFSALHAQVDFIISRDVKGFPDSAVKVLTPKEFLAAHNR